MPTRHAPQPAAKKDTASPMPTNYPTDHSIDISEAISQDPAKALALIQLQEALERKRKSDEERTARARSQAMMLKNIEHAQREDTARMEACDRNDHTREDRTSAIVGQKNGSGQLIATCQRCKQVFNGVGNGPGQLSPRLLRTIPSDAISGG